MRTPDAYLNLEYYPAHRRRIDHIEGVVCPQWTCFRKYRIDPANGKLFSRHTRPKCSRHKQTQLIFLDGLPELLARSASLSALDASILPPKSLSDAIMTQNPEGFHAFVQTWLLKAAMKRGVVNTLNQLAAFYNSYPFGTYEETPSLRGSSAYFDPRVSMYYLLNENVEPKDDIHKEIRDAYLKLYEETSQTLKTILGRMEERPLVKKTLAILKEWYDRIVKQYSNVMRHSLWDWHLMREWKGIVDYIFNMYTAQAILNDNGFPYYRDISIHYFDAPWETLQKWYLAFDKYNLTTPISRKKVVEYILGFIDKNNKYRPVSSDLIAAIAMLFHAKERLTWDEIIAELTEKHHSFEYNEVITAILYFESLDILILCSDTERQYYEFHPDVKPRLMKTPIDGEEAETVGAYVASRRSKAHVMTRKIGLRSRRPKYKNGNIIGYERISDDEIDDLRKIFIKFRDFQNSIVDHIYGLDEFHSDFDSFKQYFKYKGKNAYKGFYDTFKIKEIPFKSYKSLYFSTRSMRAASYGPYYAIRNQIIRIGNIKKIIEEMKDLFPDYPDEMQRFIAKGDLSWESMLAVQKALRKDIYGNRQDMSIEYLKNHMGQIRNIFLKDETVDQYVRTSLFDMLNDEDVKYDMITGMLRGFTRSDRKKLVSISEDELAAYLKRSFLISFKKRTTKRFTYLKNRLEKNKPLPKPITAVEIFAQDFIDAHGHDLDEFRSHQEKVKEGIELKAFLTHDDLVRLGEDALTELINDYTAPNARTAYLAAKGNYKSTRLQSLDQIGLHDFVRQKLKNKARELLWGRIFVTNDILIIGGLSVIGREIQKHINKPKFTRLTFRIPTFEQLLSINPKNNTCMMEFYPSTKRKMSKSTDPPIIFNFTAGIPSLKRAMQSAGFSAITKDSISQFFSKPPVLQLKGRKLILNQPFVTPNVSSNAKATEGVDSDKTGSGPNIVMGIDLGLKHYAVLSIWRIDGDEKEEIARYFLNQKTLYRMNFDTTSGELVPVEKIMRKTGQRLDPIEFTGNIGRRLYHLRKERSITQSEKNLLEESSPGRKMKLYHLSKTLSAQWEKMQNIHTELYHKVGGRIIEIARYHGVSQIKLEDLSWSRQKPKNQSGFYLTHNQVSFLHSKITSHVVQAADRLNIPVYYVNARWTSQLFWKAYIENPIKITRRTKRSEVEDMMGDRDGRVIRFTDASGGDHELNSDLNAARVITFAPTTKRLTVAAI